ncbi:MAG TPA: hypothetical protein VLG38_05095 [Gammaproteobacteria bacterium]|nr:hypothetical protein [Gammaproteobacteria bacterium]
MPNLGDGYDSATRKPKILSIFSKVATQKSPALSFNFSSSIYRSTDDYLKNLSASSNLEVPINSSMSLGAALQFSSDLKRSQDDTIYVIHVSGIRQRESIDLKPNTFASDAQYVNAVTELKSNPYDFCGRYGDSLISAVLYGRDAAITIRFKQATAEDVKKGHVNIEAKFAQVANLDQAIDLLRSQQANNLKCEIYIQARGFEPGQLPAATPGNFAELATWLGAFQTSFNTIPTTDFTTPVGYEFESYGIVLGDIANVVVEKSELRAKYFFAIKRCDDALDYYGKYFTWMDDIPHSNQIDLKKQELDRIKNTLDKKFNPQDPEVITAASDLNTLIKYINEVKIGTKLVNTFSANDLGRDQLDRDPFTEQRISPSFQLNDLPPGDATSFTFSFNEGSRLSSNLSFYWSLDSGVGYNGGSHRIASQIAPGSPSVANMPSGINTDQLGGLHYAFHYDRTRKSAWEALCACIPGCSKAEDVFTVETRIGGRQLPAILTLQ